MEENEDSDRQADQGYGSGQLARLPEQQNLPQENSRVNGACGFLRTPSRTSPLALISFPLGLCWLALGLLLARLWTPVCLPSNPCRLAVEPRLTRLWTLVDSPLNPCWFAVGPWLARPWVPGHSPLVSVGSPLESALVTAGLPDGPRRTA